MNSCTTKALGKSAAVTPGGGKHTEEERERERGGTEKKRIGMCYAYGQKRSVWGD